MNQLSKPIPTLLVIMFFFACAQPKQADEEVEEKGLKDYYDDYFPIGVSVMPWLVEGESADFILSEFNSLTAENNMKPGPQRGIQSGVWEGAFFS
jgi:endo-1,4-beta-xylanase